MHRSVKRSGPFVALALLLSLLLVMRNDLGYLLDFEQEIVHPTIYSFLPHLEKDSLRPAFRLGHGTPNASVVLAVPTVQRRNQTYLTATLSNLFQCMDAGERADAVVVVFVGETDAEVVESLVGPVRRLFGREISDGLLVVIGPRPSYYPRWQAAGRPRWNDSRARAWWRTKQNLDYAYLMMFAQRLARYYVQLEDDIVAAPGFVGHMLRWARAQQARSDDWLVIEFSRLGFIGKLFPSAKLKYVIEFIVMFHRDKPADWLLRSLIDSRFCHPEKSTNCSSKDQPTAWNNHNASLFQHTGVVSSLDGKRQTAKDPKFRTSPAPRHHNPAAVVSTSLRELGFKIRFAYQGLHYGWTLPPRRLEGDWILIELRPAALLSGYRIRSGTDESPSDRLYDTVVELLPATAAGADYVAVGAVDELGRADGHVDWRRFGPVAAVRLNIRRPSRHHIKIAEISLFTPITR